MNIVIVAERIHIFLLNILPWAWLLSFLTRGVIFFKIGSDASSVLLPHSGLLVSSEHRGSRHGRSKSPNFTRSLIDGVRSRANIKILVSVEWVRSLSPINSHVWTLVLASQISLRIVAPRPNSRPITGQSCYLGYQQRIILILS